MFLIRTTSSPLGSPLPLPAALLALLLAAPAAWAHPSAQPSGREGRQPSLAQHAAQHLTPAPHLSPALIELEALSDSAEEIFELAQANKLDRASKKLELLKKHASALTYLQDDSGNLLPRLGHTLVELEQALGGKNRLEVMRYANRVTLIAATVAVPLKPLIPTELSLLDYNGRELGLSSESKKTERLASIVMRMHLAWQTLMPKLVERNATKELRRFSEIMGKLEAAKTPEEYNHLSRQVCSEMYQMKEVFNKPYR